MSINKFIILILPFLFFSFVLLLSLVVFENGIYSDEIDVIGYSNGSSPFFLLYLCISISVFLIIWLFIPNEIKSLDYNLSYHKSIIYISIVLLIYFLIPILLYGPSHFLGINRYEFNSLPYVKLFNIKLFLAVFSFVWGAYHSREENKYSIYLGLYLCFIFICIAYGEKNSGIIDSMIYFACGYFLYSVSKIKLISILKFFTIIIIIIIVIFSLQLLLLNVPISELVDSFLIRLGRQSQVFWGAYELGIISDIEYNINWNGFNYYYEGLKGMKLIMYTLMSPDMYNIHSGSLAGGYPGILFLMTSDIIYLLILYIVLSIVFIIPFIVYFFLIFRVSYFPIILPFYIFAMTVHLKIFQSGNIFLLTNPKYVFFYCISLLLILLYFIKKEKYNEI